MNKNTRSLFQLLAAAVLFLCSEKSGSAQDAHMPQKTVHNTLDELYVPAKTSIFSLKADENNHSPQPWTAADKTQQLVNSHQPNDLDTKYVPPKSKLFFYAGGTRDASPANTTGGY